METQEKQKPINEYSAEELKEMLAEKEQAEKKAKKQREKAYEKEKDDFVKCMAAEMIDISSRMENLKKEIIIRGNKLHKHMYEIYDKEEKVLKQFSLISNDGMYKLEIQSRDISHLTEKAEVGINTIKEVLEKKFAHRNKVMYNIINDILMKNKKGDYDEKLVAKLRKHEEEVNDKDFSQALDDLAKAYSVVGTSLYARAYVKDPASNDWNNVPMQFSSL